MTEEEWRKYVRKNIRIRLRQKGWTQKTLANEMGLTEATISRYLNCERTPSSFVILKMAIALGCTINDLVLPNG